MLLIFLRKLLNLALRAVVTAAIGFFLWHGISIWNSPLQVTPAYSNVCDAYSSSCQGGCNVYGQTGGSCTYYGCASAPQGVSGTLQCFGNSSPCPEWGNNSSTQQYCAWECAPNGGCPPACTPGGSYPVTNCSVSCGTGSQEWSNGCSYWWQSCTICNCGWTCQKSGGCDSGNAVDPCGNTTSPSSVGISCPVCSTSNTSPTPSCGPGTYTHTDCNCQQSTVSTCTPSCGWVCDQPYDGYQHDPCVNTTYCKANPGDSTHCQQNNGCNPAYLQALYGDIHADNGLISIDSTAIPTSCYLNSNCKNDPNAGLSSGTSGVVSSSLSISFPASQVNIAQWSIQSYSGLVLMNPQYDFYYFWNKYKSQIPAANVFTNVTNIGNGNLNLPGGSVAFLDVELPTGTQELDVTGNNLSLNGNNKSIVVFVHQQGGRAANLVIKNGANVQIVPDSPGGKGNVLVWIVSGDVTIEPTVTEADGFYLVSGKFTTQPTGSGDIPLIINGGVMAYGEPSSCSISSATCTPNQQAISFQRRGTNTTQPSEKIIYNPNIVNLVPLIGESSFTWNEIAP